MEHVDQYKMKQKEAPQEETKQVPQWGEKPSRGADDVGRWQHDKFEELQKEGGEGQERWTGGGWGLVLSHMEISARLEYCW